MKKIISITLTAAVILSACTVAFAADRGIIVSERPNMTTINSVSTAGKTVVSKATNDKKIASTTQGFDVKASSVIKNETFASKAVNDKKFTSTTQGFDVKASSAQKNETFASKAVNDKKFTSTTQGFDVKASSAQKNETFASKTEGEKKFTSKTQNFGVKASANESNKVFVSGGNTTGSRVSSPVQVVIISGKNK